MVALSSPPDTLRRIAVLESQLARQRARCQALEQELAAQTGFLSPPAPPAPETRMIVFPQSAPAHDPRPLRCLGLSAREAEVLYWMSHGKTTREIAVILGSAYGTVRKHAEHIYAKLGVEGHRGAMLRAWEVLPAR